MPPSCTDDAREVEWLDGSDGRISSLSTSCFGLCCSTSHSGRNSVDLNSLDGGRGRRCFGVDSDGEDTGVDGPERVGPAEGGLRKTRGTAVGDAIDPD